MCVCTCSMQRQNKHKITNIHRNTCMWLFPTIDQEIGVKMHCSWVCSVCVVIIALRAIWAQRDTWDCHHHHRHHHGAITYQPATLSCAATCLLHFVQHHLHLPEDKKILYIKYFVIVFSYTIQLSVFRLVWSSLYLSHWELQRADILTIYLSLLAITV